MQGAAKRRGEVRASWRETDEIGEAVGGRKKEKKGGDEEKES